MLHARKLLPGPRVKEIKISKLIQEATKQKINLQDAGQNETGKEFGKATIWKTPVDEVVGEQW